MKTIPLALALTLSLAAGAAAAKAPAGVDDVTRQLSAAGYTEVRDIEFDDGLWEAEVRGKDGRWHDVAVDGTSGELMDDRGGRALMPATATCTTWTWTTPSGKPTPPRPKASASSCASMPTPERCCRSPSTTEPRHRPTPRTGRPCGPFCCPRLDCRKSPQ